MSRVRTIIPAVVSALTRQLRADFSIASACGRRMLRLLEHHDGSHIVIVRGHGTLIPGGFRSDDGKAIRASCTVQVRGCINPVSTTFPS